MRKKYSKKGNSKGKRAPLSQQQTKAVAKIASKVVKSNEEKKSYLSNDLAHSPLDATWVARNLFFPLAQGDDAENYTGKKIKVSHLTFRMQAVLSNTTNLTSRQGRFIVFWSKDTYTQTSTNIPSSELMRSPRPTNTTLQHIDWSKIRKLYEANFTLTPQVSSSTNSPGRISRLFQFKIPLNRVLTFTDNNSGLLKGGQYYIAFTGFDGSITGVPIDYGFQYSINFTDS